ncbi:DUF5959 family protein [Streptomyces lateritius]|uniref:DUF5959 family protein n=1 Tax=Streptomyces lateritius TaxID=67313 RepID=A0ABW6YGB4_9ACTN
MNRPDAGEDLAWMEMRSGPSVFIRLAGERDCTEVVVEDESGSMATVRVPLVPPDDWIADHRQRDFPRLRPSRPAPRSTVPE